LRGRTRDISAIVASTSAIPVTSGSADALMCIFSPLFPKEFSRVLRPDGVFLHVVPLQSHLIELKEKIYEHPYLNPPPDSSIDGFEMIARKDLSYSVHLRSREDVAALFQMTPYNYKTGRDDQSKLYSLEELDVTLAFGLFLYQKERRR
jgi:23S rRNA (guanine745-N1)-methyltransferase